jgi:nitrogen regulatory protein P-II 1
MKLVKAYIRTNMVDKVIHALEAGGFTDMILIDVRAIRAGIDPKDLEYSVELAERYMSVAKLEIVLEDEHVELAKETILKTARTGRKGDGLVYVSPVDETIHIRTGKAV